MKAYIGFDDTDHHDSPYGTGKLVRWFEDELPEGSRCLGVVRQQLLVCDAIPYTSHNSAACMIVEMADPALLDAVIDRAVDHIQTHSLPGSDPGLCAAADGSTDLGDLMDFGQACTHRIATQKQAVQAAAKVHLSGHGGTSDGIIGAAAAVGLTLSGWSGRFVELGRLRDWPGQTTVLELRESGIDVVSADRDTRIPAPSDTVITKGWLRPRLIAHRPVLFVSPKGPNLWENIHEKRKKNGTPIIEGSRLN
ncbi:hypothetical protein [Desulfatitalea tepidiphila]|uniref:hypothetical protein n=1 Tax=Desulfatitalea tepidiphila TaxID=1185843 RepID=UPI0006B5F986|nr:hypothetical protein [Desulfatitalea tepidiphila]